MVGDFLVVGGFAILHFDWCNITITKSFTGYIFSSWKQMLDFLEDFELNTILFPINGKNICSHFKSDSK